MSGSIKKSSSNELEYKLGDYVLLNIYYDRNDRLKDLLFRYVKIIEVDDDSVPYKVLYYTGNDSWIRIDTIERELTPEEIEEYELNLARNKFNI